MRSRAGTKTSPYGIPEPRRPGTHADFHILPSARITVPAMRASSARRVQGSQAGFAERPARPEPDRSGAGCEARLITSPPPSRGTAISPVPGGLRPVSARSRSPSWTAGSMESPRAEDADVRGFGVALVSEHGLGQIPARDLDPVFPVERAAAGRGLDRHLGSTGERRTRGVHRPRLPGPHRRYRHRGDESEPPPPDHSEDAARRRSAGLATAPNW